MTPPRLLLFDDRQARAWEPYTLTRPAGELRFGDATLRRRIERSLGVPCEGYLTAPPLAGWDEPGAPPVRTLADVAASDRTTVLLSSRVVLEPASGLLDEVVAAGAEAPSTVVVGGSTAGWVLPPGAALPAEEHLIDPSSDPRAHATAVVSQPSELSLPGSMLETPWALIRENPERLRRDGASHWRESATPKGVLRIGDYPLSLAPGAEIEQGVFVDLRSGPVRLEEGARVEAPARLVGPLHVDAGTVVFGGHVGTSSIGPVCKIRGEVADCVWMGYGNKAHDGYLGHALVGQWVNLGALTTNSDLKNNYGSVAVWTPEGRVDTGLLKVGCFLGDHVRTGIGTLLNTGTVVGTGSNVFGGAMPPWFVPPFSWGTGTDLMEYRLDKFLEGAERAMARRNVPLTPGVRSVLERAWQNSEGLRRAHHAQSR
jgi:UDP-N-acetylglucosamine diphosphorylase/glucosamine-1-phosphate N-acetyltransferase